MKKLLSLLLVLCMLISCMPVVAEENDFLATVDWDAEYDVIVVGLGLAGAATAVAASDEGASVLVLEKAPQGEEGGNSRYAAQYSLYVDKEERDNAVEYYKLVRGLYNTPSDAIIEAFVDCLTTNVDWLTEHGLHMIVSPKSSAEYPEYPGAAAIHATIAESTVSFNSMLYQRTCDIVYDRTDLVDVWFDAPAKHLIQDRDTGIIHGVMAEVNGEMYNIRAKNGVVLCTGGFENNMQMIQDYLQLPYAYSKGARYNTGDGITMAMEVGANLWHMSNIAGPDLNVINPETNVSFGFCIQGPDSFDSTGFSSGSVIWVGEDGTRFANEAKRNRHGFVDFHGSFINMPVTFPAYAIFDAPALKTNIYDVWSEDKQAEIEAGYIIEAATLEELAGKLGIPADNLTATVAQYNGFCKDGVDPFYARAAETLIPLAEEGPYYAMILYPTLTNTQGGPEKNEKGEIISLAGDPIPHLYSAGELGSLYADIYQGAGNLSECIAFGRISGKNAAAVKDDVTQESVMGGKTPVDFSVKETAEIAVAENEFIGKANGMGRDLTVKVTAEGGVIKAVEVISHSETPGIGTKAIETVPAAIVAANSTEVDTIAGATITSKAIISAVNAAMGLGE